MQGFNTKLSADAALLEATEWRGVVKAEMWQFYQTRRNVLNKQGNIHVVAVDPDGAGLEFVSDAMCFRDVAGEDSGGKTVHAVVGNLDQLLLVLELGDDDNRTEAEVIWSVNNLTFKEDSCHERNTHISSLTIFESGAASVKMVGLMK